MNAPVILQRGSIFIVPSRYFDWLRSKASAAA